MHGQLRIVLAATALMVLLAQVAPVPAECCGPWYSYGGGGRGGKQRCADCTQPPRNYCGSASGDGCNIFGCNCGGGCRRTIPGRTCSEYCCDNRQDRQDSRKPRDVNYSAISTPTGNYSGHDVISFGDIDKNGHLDEIEVHLYLTTRGLIIDGVTAWRELDTNADGKLTAAEIDNDLRSIDDVTAV